MRVFFDSSALACATEEFVSADARQRAAAAKSQSAPAGLNLPPAAAMPSPDELVCVCVGRRDGLR